MSSAEQFEMSYRKLWAALHRPDDPDLSQHEREILQHVPAKGGCSLTEIVAHLGLPKSSCSEIVKGLTRRGFLNRVRDPSDDRRLQLTLTRQGRAKVANDSVLDLGRLAITLGRLRPAEQKELVRLMAVLAELSAPSGVRS
jgi:MarR family transcriptional regulator, organic hydroperoxide resistance regulator